jgi:hypothetical protein
VNGGKKKVRGMSFLCNEKKKNKGKDDFTPLAISSAYLIFCFIPISLL